jgi:3-hydroxybutyryl-CoA dehydrogenase
MSESGMGQTRSVEPAELAAAVVGLGLMGSSITACLLASGHRVSAFARSAERAQTARQRIFEFLAQMADEGLLQADPGEVIGRLTVTSDYADLAHAAIVVESTVEDAAVKREAFARLDAVLAPDAVIGSNTSAIPISLLQQGTAHPERVLGLHWAEPAHITRFLEIVCGEATDPALAEWVKALAVAWQKEPSLVRRDIRGFITNRCFYALLREAFHLVESGVCTVDDVDRSLRNDLGSWITFAGPFRFMDLTGVPTYLTVLRDLWPELANTTEPPRLLVDLVEAGARGAANAHGFYDYTPETAAAWEEEFVRFSYEIRRLAMKYKEPHE